MVEGVCLGGKARVTALMLAGFIYTSSFLKVWHSMILPTCSNGKRFHKWSSES